MKYSLIYHSQWNSAVVGVFDTYGEALLEMVKSRKWWREHYERNIARFEIQEPRRYE